MTNLKTKLLQTGKHVARSLNSVGAMLVMALSISVPCHSQVLPSLSSEMEQHEQRFAESTFVWNIQSQVTRFSPSRSVSYEKTWVIGRDDPRTLLSGEMIGTPPTSMVVGFNQYYDGTEGILVNTKMTTGAGTQVILDNPRVWRSHTSSIRSYCPFVGLNLRAEDASLLAEFNPLTSYGAQWHLLQVTPALYSLKATISQGDGSPFILTVWLDRTKHDVPSAFSAIGNRWAFHEVVNKYVRVNDDWVASEIKSTYSIDNIISENRLWRLITVRKSQPINPTLAVKRYSVVDYRLMGEDLQPMDLVLRSDLRVGDVVQYKWSGNLPTLDQLKKLQEQQIEDAEPVHSRAWTSLIPVILLIAGAMLWYRQRYRRNNPE